ncbi:hypothetical protein [Pseudomarimonas salicorniae]|uniref:UDP pyrophosphate phosphatase n=1 Tax=Pseudomarimonas salicorniae TaxID=2933270 RepID=A0ABT0GFD1_9GAMM|nr:hypothetical protein [Lysobacter sp. CAU 1642]MCK7592752.1 hypothetical protein [Lysobacter sp. CAU 1642]
MNPLSTASPATAFENPLRIDGARPQDPSAGTERSREQQSERATQAQSGVSVAISDAARERAGADLNATQVVEGGNASSATGAETRRADTDPRGPGSLLDVTA